MTIVRTVLDRVVKLLAVVLIVSFLTFLLTKLLPGSPVNVILGPEASNPVARAALEADLGLDDPLHEQYLSYIEGVVTDFDLGRSYSLDIPTTTFLSQRLPATLQPRPCPAPARSRATRCWASWAAEAWELSTWPGRLP